MKDRKAGGRQQGAGCTMKNKARSTKKSNPTPDTGDRSQNTEFRITENLIQPQMQDP
jgi:hypothetical protein